MKLYNYYRSSAAYRVRIALNLKGITWQHVGVHLLKVQHRAPDYLKLNPAGLVPTLVADDGAVLTQSLAIMEYLDEMMTDSAPLLPKGAVDRAHVRALALSLVCDVHPLNNVRVLNYLSNELGVTAEQKCPLMFDCASVCSNTSSPSAIQCAIHAFFCSTVTPSWLVK